VEVSVIIPAYNEEESIAKTLKESANYLKRRGDDFEIIVVNDGSTDETADILASLNDRVPHLKTITHLKRQGKGEAVKNGVREARFRYCLFMDADSSTPIEEWEKFEPLFRNGTRVAVASRHLPASKIVNPQPWIRTVLGAGYRFLCRRWFELTVSDFNCGFKAYETELAKTIYDRTTMKDWTFDVEVFCILKELGITAAEVPVLSWHPIDNGSRRA